MVLGAALVHATWCLVRPTAIASFMKTMVTTRAAVSLLLPFVAFPAAEAGPI